MRTWGSASTRGLGAGDEVQRVRCTALCRRSRCARRRGPTAARTRRSPGIVQGRGTSIDLLDPWDYAGSRGRMNGGRRGRRTCARAGSSTLCGSSCLQFLTEPLLCAKTLGQKHRISPRKHSREDGRSTREEGGGEGRGGRRTCAASRKSSAPNLCSNGDEMRGGKLTGAVTNV